jgi:hypothetical protein
VAERGSTAGKNDGENEEWVEFHMGILSAKR